MSISIDLSITSWVYPFFLTIILYFIAGKLWGEKDKSINVMSYGGGGLVDMFVYGATTIVVLFMWLIWLVLKMSFGG